MVEYFGHGFPEFFLGDLFSPVPQTQFPGQFLCQGHFVVPGLFLPESHGECFSSGKFRCHQRGIHAAGQEGPHLHVRRHMGFYGIFDDLIQPVDPCFFLFLFCQPEGRFRAEFRDKILFQFQGGMFLLIFQEVTGFQLPDSLEKGFFQGRILEGQILLQGFRVQSFFVRRMRQDALDLRGKEETAIGEGIVKRFDTERIPGGVELFLFLVPYCEGEHAAQMPGQFLAPFFISVQQHFRISLGGKVMSGPDQLGPQLPVVVYFPIKYQHQFPGFVCHGLDTALQVNNAEAPESQGGFFRQPAFSLVRSPVNQGCHHQFQKLFPACTVFRVSLYKSAYSAHIPSPLSDITCRRPKCFWRVSEIQCKRWIFLYRRIYVSKM